MRNLDMTPLWRSTVGFDRLFDLLDDVPHVSEADNYPPYNIARVGEDQYKITVAVAGFSPDDITLTTAQNVLVVESNGRQGGQKDGMLYQGIPTRPFRRVFNLADYVEVKGASFENGLLEISLARELPAAMKPRRVEIVTGASRPQIESKATA